MDDIKNLLVQSCIAFDLNIFKETFYGEQVNVEASSKVAFYKYFEMMLATAEAQTIGNLRLQIDTLDGKIFQYKFFDEKHIYERLTLIIENYEGGIFLDVLPF